MQAVSRKGNLAIFTIFKLLPLAFFFCLLVKMSRDAYLLNICEKAGGMQNNVFTEISLSFLE